MKKEMKSKEELVLKTILKNQVLIMDVLSKITTLPDLRERLYYQIGFTEAQASDIDKPEAE